MALKAILFDLDGTLLPMDQDVFVKGYFGEITTALSPFGINPKDMINALWSGTKAMIKNDGQKQNIDVFWDTFSSLFKEMDINAIRSASDLFYSNEFHKAKKYTTENLLAKEAVKLAHENGRKVILATNPLFPINGQETRLSWVGLKSSDFDLITSYETEKFSKPNPKYYLSICERIGVSPEECLMIGNDENEDMYAASLVGMNCYLVNDCRIGSESHPWEGDNGSFSEVLDMLRSI